jgi:hypothetical protein
LVIGPSGHPPSPIDWLRALSLSTMLGTLSRFDKLKALSKSKGLLNGLVETAKASFLAEATNDKTADRPKAER